MRFQDSGAVKDGEKTNTEASPAHQSQQDSSDKPKILNLLNRNLCSFLQQTPGYTCNTCIGYLESCCDETFRHSIYTFLPGTHNLQKVVSIDQMLEVAAEKSVSIVDQLKLARSLVAAVLKFHSTPWLSQYLTLRDISLFQSSNDFSKCLPTLHFDTSFIDSRFDEAMAGAPEVGTDQEETTSTMARATEDAKLDHGIRNMTVSESYQMSDLAMATQKVAVHEADFEALNPLRSRLHHHFLASTPKIDMLIRLGHYSSGASASSSCRLGTGHD